jgi:hypothetical protein
LWFLLDSNSWNSVLQPIVRKNDNKTILNKFVCKGLNTFFVKLWLVFIKLTVYFEAKIDKLKISTNLLLKLTLKDEIQIS